MRDLILILCLCGGCILLAHFTFRLCDAVLELSKMVRHLHKMINLVNEKVDLLSKHHNQEKHNGN